MTRFIILLIAGLVLGGCPGFDKSILQGGSSLTASINNPVSKNTWYEIEATYAGAVRLMLAYRERQLCTAGSNETLSNPCARRSAVLSMQSADRKVRSVLVPFRKFMRANDTVNATSLLPALQAAISDFESAAKQ